MAVLTIGILAHVDAGKTSLTERILFETGVIATPGSVDSGTTQTDTLALERARGITIKSAVAAFRLGELNMYLIDTPGHADFIAEVERSLQVLDAVVLVVSAVEGVQPQTVRLARAVASAGKPLIVFINKIDRMGARPNAVLADLPRRLQIRSVPMTTAADPGEVCASVTEVDWQEDVWRSELIDRLAETDDRIIDEFDRTGGQLDDAFLAGELRRQIGSGAIVPVFVGSARTRVGVAEFLTGIERWLEPPPRSDDGVASARIFKIVRSNRGEKIAYARILRGILAPRQRITLHRQDGSGDIAEADERIVAIDRFNGGATAATDLAHAGEIVAVHGLRSARIGDWIGAVSSDAPSGSAFPAPPFESLITPVDPAKKMRCMPRSVSLPSRIRSSRCA